MEMLEKKLDKDEIIVKPPKAKKRKKKKVVKKVVNKINKYKLGELLGQGGMGRVNVAKKDGKTFALKTLISGDDRLKNLYREVKASSVLDHPNIAKIFDFDLKSNAPFIAREYRPDYFPLQHNKQIDLNNLIKLYMGIAEALTYAHSKGVVHGDIKPQNILVNKDYDALLTDFGIAKFISESIGSIGSIKNKQKSDTNLDSMNSMGLEGTIAFLAPEQHEGKQASPQSDIYALSKVMYYLITKKMPGTDANKILIKNGIPNDLTEIIVKGLSSIEERYGKMKDMLKALKAYQKSNSEEAMLVKEKNLQFLKTQKKKYILTDIVKSAAYTVIPNIPLTIKLFTGLNLPKDDQQLRIYLLFAGVYLIGDLALSLKGILHGGRALANTVGYFRGDYTTRDIWKKQGMYYSGNEDSLNWWGKIKRFLPGPDDDFGLSD